MTHQLAPRAASLAAWGFGALLACSPVTPNGVTASAPPVGNVVGNLPGNGAAGGAAELPAFPGAEGFGAASRGGRGGDVYHVTGLADDGPGSLRHGIVTAAGPRSIVFDVGGTIALRSPLLVRQPQLTIAGQTAPGAGITLADEGIIIRDTHDIVIRGLRVRRGDVHVRATGRPTKSTGLDAISIDRSERILLDHLSLSWSCDEILGIVRSRDVTVGHCLLAEPLGHPSIHPYGEEHAFAINASANRLSVHHNLIANYVMRGPQFEPNDARDEQGYDVAMEAVNNVLFDYKRSGSRYKTGIEEQPEAARSVRFHFQFENNLYLRDPQLEKAPDILAVTKYGVTDQVRVWISGNLGPRRPRHGMDDWDSVLVEGGGTLLGAPPEIRNQASRERLFTAPIPVTTSAADALGVVFERAGVSRQRDAADERVLADVNQRRYRPYLRSQAEVGGWPALPGASRPVAWDVDGDGMPDEWERQQKLDPADASDGSHDRDHDGYTELEAYLNQLPQ